MNLINTLIRGYKNILAYFKEVKKRWEDYELTPMQRLHIHFKNLIAFLIYDWNWTWLDFIISSLCELEMNIPLLFDAEFRDLINYSDIIQKYPINEEKSKAQLLIPENTFYCEGCPFESRSKLAIFFYGYQSAGYCYYLGKGDFSYIKPTDILWDGCKECGINEDVEFDEEVAEKTIKELKEKMKCDGKEQ